MRMWLSRRRDLWHALEDEIREVLRPSRIQEVIKSSYGICVYEEETENKKSDENTPILEWFIENGVSAKVIGNMFESLSGELSQYEFPRGFSPSLVNHLVWDRDIKFIYERCVNFILEGRKLFLKTENGKKVLKTYVEMICEFLGAFERGIGLEIAKYVICDFNL